MYKVFFRSVIVLVVILFYSCQSKKIVVVEKEALNSKKLYKSLNDKNIEFTNLLIKKVSIKYNTEKKHFNVSGSIAIIKDSLINIRITPIFGIQAYNILIRKDSILLLDRINRVAYRDEFSMIKKLLKHEFEYQDLQSLFIDNLVVSDNLKEIEILNKRTKFIDHLHIIDVMDYSDEKSKGIRKKYFVNDDKNRIEKFEYYDLLSNSIKVLFSEYSIKNNIEIPKKIEIAIKNKNVDIHIGLEYNKILVDEDFKIVVKLPENYQLKSLKSL